MREGMEIKGNKTMENKVNMRRGGKENKINKGKEKENKEVMK